jgi:hypothetical protein
MPQFEQDLRSRIAYLIIHIFTTLHQNIFTMLSEMARTLNQGSEHTTDSCTAVDEEKNKQGSEKELGKGRRAGLIRSPSIIITVQSPDGIKNRRGSLTFSNSVRQLSRAGSSRRHLLTDESSESYSRNSVRQLSRAGSCPPHLLADKVSSAPELPIGA